jgi:transposase
MSSSASSPPPQLISDELWALVEPLIPPRKPAVHGRTGRPRTSDRDERRAWRVLLRRYLRRTPTGLLRIDNDAIRREAHLDGKWLLRTDDLTLTGEDLAAAYKQLTAVERGWKDMKGALALRPVFHHREDRIRAHVQLCWLALLLIRVAENTTGQTWRALHHELDRMHLVTLATGSGTVAQRSMLTPGQKAILTALDLPEPPRFFDFAPAGA